MPVYHFTFHAFGTWLPDKPKGYVQRSIGIRPRDDAMARHYRANQKQPSVYFNAEQQNEIAAALHVAGQHLCTTIHCLAVEPTHIHILLSWRHGRGWSSVRNSLKSAVSRALSQRFGRRSWLVKGASRKQVKDDEHFCYLVRDYLPAHRGVFWLREADRRRFVGDDGAGEA